MKTKFLSLAVLIALMISSCMEEPLTNERASKNISDLNIGRMSNTCALLNGHLKIALVSDIHYLDPSLLQNGAADGEAFQTYLMYDPKLIQYSDPIFKEVITELKAEKPDVLLITGDLTKDGERVSHETMAALLGDLKDSGIKVLVLPGNHDINNPEAKSYDGNTASPTPSVSASEFSTIYGAFGFDNAIARDANSLSYVYELFSDLWVIAIDANKYEENTGSIATVGGVIKPATLQWIQDQLTIAKENNITVLGMMHHNLIEHYSGQSQLDPGYVIDNWETTADALINAGLKVMFTGHYHANDATARSNNGNIIYDVETGSLVTPLSPYRIAVLKNKELDISTNRVVSINTTMPGGLDFPTYSNLFFSAHLDGYFGYALTQAPFGLSDSLAAASAPLFRNAYMAHCAGDEKISPAERSKDNALAQISPLAGMALTALWTDINTSDNKLHFKVSGN